MSVHGISTAIHMDIEDPPLLSASGMPLSTIPELPGDEYEPHDEQELAELASTMLTKDIFITTSVDQDTATSSDTKAAGSQQQLSINLSFLAPSSPVSLSSANSSSPPSATYSSSSSPSVSSPGSGLSPILNPFQWTSDLRQYIITDIGPQPANSQVPALRSNFRLVRQRSYSKMSGPGFATPSPTASVLDKGVDMSLSPFSPGSYFSPSAKLATSVMSPATSLQTQALVGQYGNNSSNAFYSRPRHGSMTDLSLSQDDDIRMTMMMSLPWDNDDEM